jgi:DNA-directed RNA polymerase specialized sigma24 family protein
MDEPDPNRDFDSPLPGHDPALSDIARNEAEWPRTFDLAPEDSETKDHLADQCIDESAASKPATKRKKDWELTGDALHRLLHWLDEGKDSDGLGYHEMRRELARRFKRRGCPSAEDLADKTLDRVARRLEEEGSITGISPAQYCYTIARTVFLEYWGSPEYRQVNLDEGAEPVVDSAMVDNEREEQEKLMDCLERCMQELDPASREMIIEYYQGEKHVKIENRKVMAGRLKVSIEALRNRAVRIRARLEACISDCARRR